MSHNEDEPTLKDVMTALRSINSRLDDMAAPKVPLLAIDEQQHGMSQATVETHDVFDGMEEAVCCNVANRLRGISPVYAAHLD